MDQLARPLPARSLLPSIFLLGLTGCAGSEATADAPGLGEDGGRPGAGSSAGSATGGPPGQAGASGTGGAQTGGGGVTVGIGGKGGGAGGRSPGAGGEPEGGGASGSGSLSTGGASGTNDSVDIGISPVAATGLFLRAPSLTALSGVTLGEAAITAPGAWTPRARHNLPVRGNVVAVMVPPASAVLVRAR